MQEPQIDIEAFKDDLAMINNIDENNSTAFFIKEFKQPTDILLAMFKNYVKLGERELEVLRKSE